MSENVEGTLIDLSSLSDVKVNMTRGNFELVGYDDLKFMVSKISEYLKDVEVTEENIKENKKLVARVRKAVDELNRQRIDVKQLYLMPYEAYAVQVKELSDMTTEAEETVRQQIRELEEMERAQKEQEIKKLFNKRLRPYSHTELMLFDEFMRSSYTNKTCSMKKIEEEMVQYLQSKDKDYYALQGFADSTNTPIDNLVEDYKKYGSVSEVMNHYFASQKEQQRASEPVKETTTDTGFHKDTKTPLESNMDKEADSVYLIAFASPESFEEAKAVLFQNEIPYSVFPLSSINYYY